MTINPFTVVSFKHLMMFECVFMRQCFLIYNTFVSSDPEDVDVFVGGVMENAVEGGVVGPLFSCLIGDQFMRWKTGDRFWFERDDPVTGFTEGKACNNPYIINY